MSKTVLIIDDIPHIRRLLSRMLSASGYQTLLAEDGAQGLEMVREHKPDIVTCDVSMPIVNGHQFLLSLRQDPTVSHIPVIMVTALGEEAEGMELTNHGADGYITKPFSSSLFIKLIEEVITSKA